MIFKKICSKIVPVLRIDGHTATNSRGHFARLCVQVYLDKPLVKNILIRKFKQPVTYEGIYSLCFSCGLLGHKKECCQYTIGKAPKPLAKCSKMLITHAPAISNHNQPPTAPNRLPWRPHRLRKRLIPSNLS